MMSRRTFLQTAIAAAGAVRAAPAGQAHASQPATAVGFAVPPGACDCHVHVFGDPRKFPFFPGRVYTPEPASVDELRNLLRALSLSRVVVVQPSVYGADNRCTLDALAQLGERARGVAVIDRETPGSALDEMHRAGIRGIRLNLTQGGITDPAIARKRLQAGLERIRARGWHVQILLPPGLIPAIADLVQGSPVPVVFDHFGGVLAAHGLQQPGFQTLLRLVQSGRAYVKISAAADYMSSRAPDYPDVAPLARALVAANPQRILWGTNWPHPNPAHAASATAISPLLPTDDGRVLNLLPGWVPDAVTRAAILVENPERLYGF